MDAPCQPTLTDTALSCFSFLSRQTAPLVRQFASCMSLYVHTFDQRTSVRNVILSICLLMLCHFDHLAFCCVPLDIIHHNIRCNITQDNIFVTLSMKTKKCEKWLFLATSRIPPDCIFWEDVVLSVYACVLLFGV